MTEPGAAKSDPILVVDHVVKRFGGLTAVDVDHLEIDRGSITALIGPNGAGKTTFFNLLTGFDSADSGHWTLDGRAIERLPSHRIARLGMVRTFQLTKVLSGMSVLENMLLAAEEQPGERFFVSLLPPLWRRRETEVAERARGLLDQVGMAAKADDMAGTLSGGQRKLLELARVLMLDPSVVMLDEPMAGVNPALTESLLQHVAALRDQGRTVVFVEHDMDVVHSISDWVVVLAEGRVIAEGTPAAVTADQAVVDAYLGRGDTEAREDR
ncbi:MAG: ABC transporter ATP-binding protein [Acidimicrobiales bacterium]|nr:ABC transporter ATP-binding protein [Acidimicrobiales bacterium]